MILPNPFHGFLPTILDHNSLSAVWLFVWLFVWLSVWLFVWYAVWLFVLSTVCPRAFPPGLTLSPCFQRRIPESAAWVLSEPGPGFTRSH